MIEHTTIDDIDEYAKSTNVKLQPSMGEMQSGAVSTQCIPAGWWNWLFNALTLRAKQANHDIEKIIAELKNVMARVGDTPDPSLHNQLAEAIKAYAPGIATSTVPGAVRSNGGLNNVSVTVDGQMVANGVGNIGTSPIIGVSEVKDIVTAINYLTKQIYGYGMYVPENQLDSRGKLYWCMGKNPSAFSPDINMNMLNPDSNIIKIPGGHWYRFILIGGSGGKGGEGATGEANGSYGSMSGSGTGTGTVTKGATGTAYAGYGGNIAWFDRFIPADTTCVAWCGNNGGNGGNGSQPPISSHTPRSTDKPGDGGTGGAPVTFNASRGTAQMPRLPTFLQNSNAGDAGYKGEYKTASHSGSSGGSAVYVYGGGGGGGGSAGNGTMLLLGGSVFAVAGGSGGAGGNGGGCTARTYSSSQVSATASGGSGGDGGRFTPSTAVTLGVTRYPYRVSGSSGSYPFTPVLPANQVGTEAYYLYNNQNSMRALTQLHYWDGKGIGRGIEFKSGFYAPSTDMTLGGYLDSGYVFIIQQP